MELPGRETVSSMIEVKPDRPLKVVTFTLPLPAPGSGMVRPGQLVSFGPEVLPPARIAGSVPRLPETARERGLEGTPSLEVWVSETGEVFNIAVLESAGEVLDDALLAAVSRWRFRAGHAARRAGLGADRRAAPLPALGVRLAPEASSSERLIHSGARGWREAERRWGSRFRAPLQAICGSRTSRLPSS